MTKPISSIFALCLAVSAAACATPPDRIDPIKTASAAPCTVGDRKYLTYLTEEQGKLARQDAIGVLVIGVPVGSFGQEDYSKEIAHLKGRCG